MFLLNTKTQHDLCRQSVCIIINVAAAAVVVVVVVIVIVPLLVNVTNCNLHLFSIQL
jgi:hypothetical protein